MSKSTRGSVRALLNRALLHRSMLRSGTYRTYRGEAESRLLFIRAHTSPLRKLAHRGVLVAALLGLVMLIFWIERANLRDTIDGHISFVDVVYFTLVTVTTVGYGDIVPVGDRARLIDALLVTPVRIFVWFIFLGTAYELVFRRIIEGLRMNALRESLREHIVVCGFGYSGRTAALEMTDKGLPPHRIVVIEPRPERLEEAAEAGYIGLRGDATREIALRDAGVPAAQALLVCISRDDATALTVLTARSLSPNLRIIATVMDEENIKLVRKAGADEVISPAKLSGFLLADAVASRHTTRFISDILTSRGGLLKISERPVLPAEVGKGMRDVAGSLIVAIEREGAILGFWDAPGEVMRTGDIIFAIEARAGAPAD